MKSNRTTLHVDDRLMPIFSSRCRGQSQNEFCFDFPKDSVKRDRRKMMTFTHNDVSVGRDEIFACPFTLQALNHSNINQTGSLGFPSPVLPNVLNRQC